MPLQNVQVVVNDRRGTYLTARLDVSHCRRELMLTHKLLDEIKYSALTF